MKWIDRAAIFAATAVAISTLVAGCGQASEQSSLSAAKASIAKRDLKSATVQLKAALGNNPSSAEARYLLGASLLDMGDLLSLLEKAEQVISQDEAKKASPEQREDKIKNGFAALRTSYETQVVFGLFKGVVQRFEERVSVDSLKSVFFTTEIRDEILDNFYQCCRYMEGHSHSDKYAYKKPELENLGLPS